MVNIKYFLLLLLLITETSYAGFQQNISTAIQVDKNEKNNYFQVMFRSSDFFDAFRATEAIQLGSSLVSHLYEWGPKKIKIKVGISNDNSQALILPSYHCSFLIRKNSHWFESDYMETQANIIQWVFTFEQIGEMSDFKDVYQMDCLHYSAP